MGFLYCLRNFFFDSQGRVLQDISPIVLNTSLQHEKKKKLTINNIFNPSYKFIYCISVYMTSESFQNMKFLCGEQ